MPEPPPRPALATAPLSVVLPARNAAAVLTQVLTEWSAYLAGLGREFELLVVDDGSSDGTAAQAAAAAGTNPRLRVLAHARPQGFGAALRTGLDAARFPLVCTATCDRQYDPVDLGRLLARIDEVDVVAGYRLLYPVPRWLRLLHGLYRGALRVLFGAAPAPPPTWLGWQGCGRRLLARWLFAVRVHDPACVLRLYRRELFARIPLQSDGTFALVEVLAKANFLGAWMAEEPVSYTAPAGPAEAVDSPARDRTAAEVYRVLTDPDFGPPFLPGLQPGPQASPEGCPTTPLGGAVTRPVPNRGLDAWLEHSGDQDVVVLVRLVR